MASNKNTKKVTLAETFDAVKEKAGVLNNEVISTTDAFVEGSVESIKQWQDVLGKAINNGTELFEQQQNIALDALENVVNQTKNGGVRMKSLLNFDLNFKSFWNKNKPEISIKSIKKTAVESFETAKETIGNAKETIEDKIEDVLEAPVKEVKKASKRVTKKATKTAKKTTAKAKKAVSKK